MMELDVETRNKILNILKFKQQGMTISEISRKVKINRNSVAKYLQLLEVSGQVEMQVVGNAKVFTTSRRLPLASVLRYSTNCILVLDSEGKIQQVNNQFLEFFGISRDDLRGKMPGETGIPFFDSPETQTAIDRSMEGTELLLEFSHDGDGDNRIMGARFRPTVSETGEKGLTIIMEDLTDKKRAEAALGASEERFRNLVDNSPFPISIIDPAGRYLYINNQFTEQFGYTMDDVPTGKDWFTRAFPDPAMRKEVISAWKSDLEHSEIGAIRPRLYPVTCRDGSVKKIRFHPVTMQDGNQFVFYEDCTASSRMDELQSLFASIVEFSEDAIIAKNLMGNIVTWNRGAEQLYGYAAEEIIGKPFSVLIPAQSRREVLEREKKILDGQPGNHIEMQHLTKDGEYIDVSCSFSAIRGRNGSINGASVICRDISAKKQAEEAKRTSEELYRTLFQSTGTGMMIVEEDMTISLVNKQMEKLSGYSREELEGKQWTDFIPEKEREQMVEYHIRRQQGLPAPKQYEFSFIHKSGRTVNGLITASKIPGTMRTIASIVDISKRKEAEEAMQQAHEKLEQQMLEHTRELMHAKEILQFEIIERKYAEKTLREQQNIILACLNQMGLVMVGIDPDGRIRTINKIGREILGYQDSEVIGQHWVNLCIPEPMREEVEKLHHDIVTGMTGSVISLRPVHTRSGEERDLVWIIRGIRENEGKLSTILWLGEYSPGKKVISLSKHM